MVNASPDLRTQIERTLCLHPQSHGRSSPISGVVLTGGEVDTLAGLLTLRERQSLAVVATQPVIDILDSNSVFDVLARDVVRRIAVPVRSTTPLPDGGGLTCHLFPVQGKVPLFLERTEAQSLSEDGGTVGVEFQDGMRRLVFIPGCASVTSELAARLRGADCVLFDGTLFTDDEMIQQGVGTKTGQRMGHISVSGPDGAISAFVGLNVGRKIFIHINNTNPILLEDSPEHAAVRAAGWEVAWDGMEITL